MPRGDGFGKIRKILRTLLIVGAVQLLCAAAHAQSFTFNSGTNQGWSYRVVNSSTGVQIRTGGVNWTDFNNYPNFLTDPIGDGNGAVDHPISANDYSLQADPGQFLVVQFLSPDLSGLANWQDTFSFSAKLLPSYNAAGFTPDAFANLGIIVNDLDTGTQRSFVNGTATPINDAEWSHREFDFSAAFAAASPPVSNYEILQVVVNFFVAVESDRFVFDPLFFDVDDVIGCDSPSIATCHPFDDEAAFRAAAGNSTTYGFEINGLSENVNDLPPSPVPASDFDGNFDISYTNLNGFNVANDPGAPCNTDGVKSLFTHSVVASDYTLTFSNFGNADRAVTAFGLTVCDFASNVTEPATITYDTGTRSGTLLTVPNGQPDFAKNFVGIIVDPADAFASITLTFDDNLSGFQWFDEVIYTQTAAGDRDGDGVPDGLDNCPDFANDQTDIDGNGRGDACECGDQNGDGTIDVNDLLAINAAIFNPALVTPLCDANDDGACNVSDILAANAAIFGATTFCARSPEP